jgi:hypothetical protein
MVLWTAWAVRSLTSRRWLPEQMLRLPLLLRLRLQRMLLSLTLVLASP